METPPSLSWFCGRFLPMKGEFFLPAIAKSLLIGTCVIDGAFSLILWRLVVKYLYLF